jgi:hypothetical protein
MNADQFVMWLHGYFEIENPGKLDEHQTRAIKEKLEGLFTKVTPNRNPYEFGDPRNGGYYAKAVLDDSFDQYNTWTSETIIC